jgi:ornithine cyclodeaminase/alanine dehydrogenase-like protein (mu-crystallin family)
MPRYLSASELGRLISVPAAVDALERAFTGFADGARQQVPRLVTPISEGDDDVTAELLLMPAFGAEGTGVKIVTIARENPSRGLPLVQGTYVLFSQDDLSPELLIDAAALTSLRTASVSALATRHLARPDSGCLVVFGAGAQAEAHIRAMLAVRPIERVTLVATSPTSPRARGLVQRMSQDDIEIDIGTADAVAVADIVCTCTTSSRPVFDGDLLPSGAHVNAVGAYRPDMCELEPQLLARASVTVETLEAAEAEAGDLLTAIAAGALPREGFARELADVVSGRAGRRSDDEVTVFKSVGLAVEDLVIARAVADQLAAADGPGRMRG